MNFKNIKEDIEKNQKIMRDWVLIIGMIVSIIFGLVIPYKNMAALPLWPWAFALLLLFVVKVAPIVIYPFFKIWMFLGHWLGFINTRIILGIIYFLTITPLGFLFKIIGKDPLRRKFDSTVESYKIFRDDEKQMIDQMERPF